MRDLPPRTIMKILEISLFKLPFLLKSARRRVQEQILQLEPVPGIVEMLKGPVGKVHSLV
jgi:hypothetical protein